MSETAQRYRSVAAAFSDRARAVPPDGWDRPSPCEGWVARDVIRHLVDTAAFVLGPAEVTLPEGPSVDDDPVGAWEAVRDAVQVALEDPEVAGREFDGPVGRTSVEAIIGGIGIADVLIHTWDLARAVGLDDRLDSDEVVRAYEVVLPLGPRGRGTAFGPEVEVPDDADPQTRLLGFTGRDPRWSGLTST